MSRPPGEFSMAAALDASHQRRGVGAGPSWGRRGPRLPSPGRSDTMALHAGKRLGRSASLASLRRLSVRGSGSRVHLRF